jgi:amidase
VPVAFSEEGLPIGVQVVAPHRQDFRALGIAHAIEQVTHAGDRRPGLVTS